MSALIYHGRGTCDRCEVGHDTPLCEIEGTTTNVRYMCRSCVVSLGLTWPTPRTIEDGGDPDSGGTGDGSK